MQYDEGLELQKAWGDKPCSHPVVVKEYYLGSSTGDRICTTCGRSASKEYFDNLAKTSIEAK
ncbi:hypothetical protein ABEX38_21935 [Priestia megaterium]